MLQTAQNPEQQRFLEDVKALGLRFPVKVIASKTGFSKGNVSSYVNGGARPSENFLKKFYECFHVELQQATKGPVETPPLARTGSTIDSLAESTAKLSESNLINAKNIDRLISLLEGQASSSKHFSGAQMQEIHSAKLYALEEYVMTLGQRVNGSDRKSESVALGKLEGEGFRLGEGTYTLQNEDGDMKHSPQKSETSKGK
jgi:transcriptional regulator with XRE-family HTH domain